MKSAKHLLAFFFFATMAFASFAGQSKVDSLLMVLKTAARDTNKVTILNDLGYELKRTDQPRAIAYAEEAQKLAEQLSFLSGLIESHNVQRFVYYSQHNYPEALKHATFNFEKNKQLNDAFKTGKSAYAIANIYFRQNNYSEALKWYIEALKDYEKVNNQYEIGVTQEAIGAVFLGSEQLDNALEYYKKSLYTATLIHDSVGIALGYSNVGIVLGNQKKYLQAFEIFDKSISILEHLNDTAQLIEVFMNKGVTYKKAELYTDAIKSYMRCSQFLSSVQPVDSLSLSYLNSNIGLVYSKMHINDLAEDYLQRGLNYSSSVNDNNLKSESYNGLYAVYKDEGDFKKALEYHLKYIALHDSLLSVDKNRQIAEMQAKYEGEEKDLKINSLNQQNQVKESELKQQRIINYSFIGSFVLVLIIVFVLYNRFQIKKRSNTQLAKTNGELEQTLSDLKSTQAQLLHHEKMASLGQLTAGIAHEIKNPLNFVTNFSELSVELIDELKTASDEDRPEIIADLKRNLQKINEHGNRADNIVKSMLQHSRSGSEVYQPTDINVLCEEFLNLAYHGMRAQLQNFNCDLKKDLATDLPKVNAIQNDISRVLLNLINNAFYAVKQRQEMHASGDETYKPIVTITTKSVKQQIIISIKDNGIGIPESLKEKIFMPFFTTKPSGEGTGLGLSLSFDIIQGHGGNLKLISEQGQGTEFIISLPAI